MKKGDKIIVSFYIFLAISFSISLVFINSTFEELPEITNILPKKITELEFETEVNVGKKDFFNIMINVEEYPKILPNNIISVKIIEKNNNTIIAEEEFSEAGIKIKMLVKHSITPYDKQIIEILDGDAKGTKISQIFIGNETYTKISNKIKFELKGLLSPIGYLPQKSLIHAMDTTISSFEVYAKGFDSEYEKTVDDLYREILKRPADKEGLQHFSSLLESKEMSIEDIRKTLLASYEGKLKGLKPIEDLQANTKEIINKIYIEMLSRNADEGGLSHYGTLFENKEITIDEIRNKIYNSDEGVSSRINTDLKRSIDNVYLELFERHIDQDTLMHYEELLVKKKITLDEIREELASKIKK